ncbi:MAG TPA: hypothetical protein V6D46_09710 [Coleofasciculaceae cyanobacterium]
MFVGTRVFMGVVSYLIVLQLLSPALQECPDGSCLWRPLLWASECGQYRCASACEAYEYRQCGPATTVTARPVQPVMVGK